MHSDFVYRSNLKRQGRNRDIIYWECVRNREIKCRARLKSIGDRLYVANMNSKSEKDAVIQSVVVIIISLLFL